MFISYENCLPVNLSSVKYFEKIDSYYIKFHFMSTGWLKWEFNSSTTRNTVFKNLVNTQTYNVSDGDEI